MYIDLAVVVFYFLLIFFISYLSRARSLEEMFVVKKSISWWLASASLLMFWWNPANDMMVMGVLVDKGYSGTWILHSRLLTLGIAPIIFAPLWARLRFMNDNQFILFRFSGRGARILHQFRAMYVGLLVVVFLISFGLLGMNKLWQTIFGIAPETSLIFSILLVSIVLLKNAFRQKIRTDVVHTVLYLVTPLVGVGYIFDKQGGIHHVLHTLQTQHPEKVALVPDATAMMGGEAIANFLVFVLIQWWSANILDSSGPEAQRYMSSKNGWDAFRAAFLPVIVVSVLGIFTSLIQDAVLLQHMQSPVAQDTEALYLQSFVGNLPAGLRAIALLAFAMGFVTTIEAMINWGASFLVVDSYKTYWRPHQTDKHYQAMTYLAMYLILATAALVVYYNDYMLAIQKFVFSITAGVGPVFVLRWFWWRVNAWAQLAAMLGSLFFTISFDAAYAHWYIFHEVIAAGMQALHMDYYPFKLIILTLLVTLFWLWVMYMTPPDDEQHLRQFVQQVRPGGWWPRHWHAGEFQLKKKLWLVFLYAIVNVLPVFFIWEMKFGEWWVAIGLMTLLVGIIFYVLLKMKHMSSYPQKY